MPDTGIWIRDALIVACEACLDQGRWLVLQHPRFANAEKAKMRLLSSQGPFVRVLNSTTGLVDIRPELLLKWLRKMEKNDDLRHAK